MNNWRYYLNNFMQNSNKLQNKISFYIKYIGNVINQYRL